VLIYNGDADACVPYKVATGRGVVQTPRRLSRDSVHEVCEATA
jgi:hypothetical protein